MSPSSSSFLPLPPPSLPSISLLSLSPPPSSSLPSSFPGQGWSSSGCSHAASVCAGEPSAKEGACHLQEKALHQDLQGWSVCLSIPCSISVLSVCFFWSLSPSHNSSPPSHTLHALSTHSPHTHILTIHSHPCLYSQPSHISLIPHSYPLPIPISTPSQVIPLSQRSGIVEWCEETRPLGEYLIGPPQSPYQGAHYRYRPSDSSSMECRKKLVVGVAHWAIIIFRFNLGPLHTG